AIVSSSIRAATRHPVKPLNLGEDQGAGFDEVVTAIRWLPPREMPRPYCRRRIAFVCRRVAGSGERQLLGAMLVVMLRRPAFRLNLAATFGENVTGSPCARIAHVPNTVRNADKAVTHGIAPDVGWTGLGFRLFVALHVTPPMD